MIAERCPGWCLWCDGPLCECELSLPRVATSETVCWHCPCKLTTGHSQDTSNLTVKDRKRPRQLMLQTQAFPIAPSGEFSSTAAGTGVKCGVQRLRHGAGSVHGGTVLGWGRAGGHRADAASLPTCPQCTPCPGTGIWHPTSKLLNPLTGSGCPSLSFTHTSWEIAGVAQVLGRPPLSREHRMEVGSWLRLGPIWRLHTRRAVPFWC